MNAVLVAPIRRVNRINTGLLRAARNALSEPVGLSLLPGRAVTIFVSADVVAIGREGNSQWVVGGPKGAAAKLGLKCTSLAYKMHRLGIVPVRKRRRFRQQGAVTCDSRAEVETDTAISNEDGYWAPAGLSKLMSTVRSHVAAT